MKQFLPILKRSLLVLMLMSFLILVMVKTVQSASSSSNSFPENWQGTWSGTMFNRSVKGQSKTVPMILKIQPISNNPLRYTWQITYEAGAKKQLRNYELVIKDRGAGHFVIDEKDGTLIDAWWVGDTLYSQFRVGNRLLNSQYERQSDRLRYKLVTYQPLSSPPAKGSQQKVPFESYQIGAVQSAELAIASE
ncbi:hypothetical protein [uncultured Nostoc sp.]|uniref:hypothetical protein n=2 Tax=Nostoc TaxID=1177 RepID=UPI0035C9D170